MDRRFSTALHAIHNYVPCAIGNSLAPWQAPLRAEAILRQPRHRSSDGFGDLEGKRKVDADERFHIGSISKSFVALVLLQLHDEGKLDFHRPIADDLPWFAVESSFAPITTHHCSPTHYRNESPWVSSTRVVILKGKLMLDGVTPLAADGEIFAWAANL